MRSPEMKIPQLVEEVAGNLGDIVRNEVRLAKAEASQGAADAMRGIILLAVALMLLIPAVVVLALGVSSWLSEETGFSAWTANLLVGGVLAGLAVLALAIGGKSLGSRHVRLGRSIRSVGKDIETIREAT